MKTRPDVKNTDDSNTSSAVEWPCRSCHKKLSTKEELTIHVASCNKKGVLCALLPFITIFQFWAYTCTIVCL